MPRLRDDTKYLTLPWAIHDGDGRRKKEDGRWMTTPRTRDMEEGKGYRTRIDTDNCQRVVPQKTVDIAARYF